MLISFCIAALQICCALFGTAAFADQVYECNFTQKSANGGWIPEIVVIEYESANRRILAYDPLIKRFVGEPIEGKIGADNAKRVTFTWDFRQVTAASMQG